jgi:hypothetical protein
MCSKLNKPQLNIICARFIDVLHQKMHEMPVCTYMLTTDIVPDKTHARVAFCVGGEGLLRKVAEGSVVLKVVELVV